MAGELILIVEDDERNMRLARDVLRHGGFRTLEAASGRAGVALAARHLPDAILMDIGLPDIDGMAVLGLLRADPRTRTIPVAALTALAMKGDRERFLAAGFDDYMAKPIEVRRLSERTGALCARAGVDG
jgi:two-component system cell cycle response regulator DivK